MVKDLSTMRHFGRWAIEACYDMAGRYGHTYPDCPKEEVVDEVAEALKKLGY